MNTNFNSKSNNSQIPNFKMKHSKKSVDKFRAKKTILTRIYREFRKSLMIVKHILMQ